MKLKYILCSALSLALLNSCSDELKSGKEMPAGDAIIFSASTNNANSRTAYGPLDEEKNVWPVYWVTNDKVAVYCPEAGKSAEDPSVGTNLATYTVGTANGTSDIYDLTAQWGGLYWGEDDIHHFYTFYPTDNLYLPNASGTALPDDTKKLEDGWIVGAVPREQNATVTTTTSGNANIITAVDMNAAIMAGHTYESRVNYGGNITLPFTPITTAVDIVIKAPKNIDTSVEGMYDQVTVTSIQIANTTDAVASRTPLAGGFYWNHRIFEDNGKVDSNCYALFTNSVTSEDAQSYTVNVLLGDEGVTLRTNSDDELTVTAFLLPSGLPENLRVIVNCKENVNSGENGIITKVVKKNSTAEGNKCTINLGLLPNPIVFSYETWMANLPDNTYVSQISMPGTHDAGAYSSSSVSSSTAQTQTLSIEQQLNAGIRVLDFRPSYEDGTFDISHGFISLDITYDDVLELALNWLAEHPTEFIIIQLKNESSGHDGSGFLGLTGKEWAVYWRELIRAKLESISSIYSIQEFNPSLTLKDARSKFVFMSRDDYYSDDNYTEYGNWIGCKISGWPDNNNDSNLNTNGGDTSMPWYRSIMTMYNNTSNDVYGTAHGTIYVSDLYKNSSKTSSPSESDKKAAILNSLNNCKDKTGEISTWCMTWLNTAGLIYPSHTGVYNAYAAEVISGSTATGGSNGLTGFSQGSEYENAGIVMVDWAGYATYNGDAVIQAVIDNNFRAGGPAQKQSE